MWVWWGFWRIWSLGRWEKDVLDEELGDTRRSFGRPKVKQVLAAHPQRLQVELFILINNLSSELLAYMLTVYSRRSLQTIDYAARGTEEPQGERDGARRTTILTLPPNLSPTLHLPLYQRFDSQVFPIHNLNAPSPLDLRSAAIKKEYCVIKVNAWLSCSSTLTSKATSYPLAYTASKIPLGPTLLDLPNAITKTTTRCIEPRSDYIVTNVPKCHVTKLSSQVDRNISSSMKNVGELMVIGRTWEESLQKAVRMVDPKYNGFEIGGIDKWYFYKLDNIVQIVISSTALALSTNYLYVTYNATTHDVGFNKHGTMVLGSGVYRIGTSVELDWCVVTCARELTQMGRKTVIINYNPETVVTDFDEVDRLYFEELGFERVMDVYEMEGAEGVVVSVGGQSLHSLSPLFSKMMCGDRVITAEYCVEVEECWR
ncbi:hypothetical protein JAAARDRAFT_196114 [Jaapia argillacea MUCL 33604]|uniref:Ammonium-dependent carbamoyl phosphate synthetase n=1 Tax=Jaapia argillacea MUCL 33604 TaxID=933084 RepID=A0A067PVG0_9AGAM|nr:hypothetical protein JAAARDRAFT_196114 [Jaapia argillacea MUCL 33604]